MMPEVSYPPSPAGTTLYDAVVVGAGPAGSTMAYSLARQGWQVLLIERDHFPRHKVCGEFLSPEAQETLRSLGLYGHIAALHPVPLGGGQVTAHNGRRVEVNMPGEAWGISRYALDAVLASAAEASGVELWTGTTVTGWQQGDQNITIQLRKGQTASTAEVEGNGNSTLHTRALIMACGRHSLAGLLPNGAKRRSRRSPAKLGVGVKCHYARVSMPAQVELYLFAGGYVGINPVENDNANVCALASYKTFARAGRSPTALIKAAARWNPAFGKRLRHAKAVAETECSVAPVDTRRKASAWDGVPLLGDTAAMIPPLFGDGMAMALRSAELCAPLVDEYLRCAFSWEELGEQYRQLWHHEFDHRLYIGRLLERMLQKPKPTNLLLRVGETLPSLADYLVRATRGKTRT
jgi:flavin-dependent dehydrogenase